MNVTVIIQARMGARRLPDKVLLDLAGKTVLERVVGRVRQAKTIKDVVVATTENLRDRQIVELAAAKGIDVYVGSEEDVLDRYYQAARACQARHVVRITADCPLIDPEVMDEVVTTYFKRKADYCSNTLKPTFPDGLDVEVFSFQALAEAWHEAKLKSQREHVTPFIHQQPGRYKLENVEHVPNLGEHRWTLDEPNDYEVLKRIYQHFAAQPDFRMKDVLHFLEDHPEIAELNQGIIRNEGYLQSVRQDGPAA